MQRMPSLLALIAAAGYNALLVEWEGMFPWTVDARFRCGHAYSPADVENMLAIAGGHGLQVIPLVQCFGHMETPLSVDDYARLRHVPHRAGVINPLAPRARELVERMIDDVLALCGPGAYFHLGGDEAFSFGKTDADRAFIAEHGAAALYLRHVEPLLDKLLAKEIRPILWHDMMSSWPVDDLHRLQPKVDLMVWGYSPEVARSKGHQRMEVIERFHDAGMRLWAGCAYKGADGPSADVPNFQARCDNALAWVNTARRFGFVAAACTAWSRYTTHRPQCQPIDGSLDTLLATGLILQHGSSLPNLRETALSILDRLGERSKFEALRAALADMQRQREDAWNWLRQLREHLAMAERDPFRRKSAMATELLKDTVWFINNARQAAERAKPLLRGMIADADLDEYFVERFEPLDRQIPDLIAQVSRQEPETWQAAVKHLAAVDSIFL